MHDEAMYGLERRLGYGLFGRISSPAVLCGNLEAQTPCPVLSRRRLSASEPPAVPERSPGLLRERDPGRFTPAVQIRQAFSDSIRAGHVR